MDLAVHPWRRKIGGRSRRRRPLLAAGEPVL